MSLSPANRFTTMVYDSLNRQIEVIDATNSPSTTYYDAVSNVTGMRDGNNLLTQYQVDSLNRVTVTIDPRNYRTTTQFDAVGNITAITDASNNTSTFAYDSLNRKVTETDALGNSATFAYNAVGLLTSNTDRLGRRRDFGYDLLNRRTTEIWYSSGGSATETMTYSFDAGGNALTATDSDGTYTMTYNELNQVTQVEDLWGNILTFTYDDAGNRTVVEDSEGGVVSSSYDGNNQLTAREWDGTNITSVHLEFQYDSRGLVTGTTRYTGNASPYSMMMHSSFTYDDASQLTEIHHKLGTTTTLSHYTYSYDDGGRVTEEIANSSSSPYSYDDSNQLTGDGVNTYTYDPAGNRTMAGYTTDTGNRLTSDGTWDYEYDAEGSRTKKTLGVSDETWTYGYDHRNQMTWVEKRSTDGGTLELRVEFEYDVFGNRIEKRIDNDGDSTIDSTERYAYDGWKPGGGFVGNENWDVWADLDGSGSLTTRYLRGDIVDQLFARMDGSGVGGWYLTDRQSSVRQITDTSGTVQNTITYDGFGQIVSESNSSYDDRYKYTSREYDSEIELQYNRARYYDASVGRWLSQDPIRFEAGDTNLYRYVNNSPTMATDPSGLQFRYSSNANSPSKGIIDGKQIGGFTWDIKWLITDKKAEGFIVQKVTVYLKIFNNKDRPQRYFNPGYKYIPNIRENVLSYYELWEVTQEKGKNGQNAQLWMGYKTQGRKAETATVHDRLQFLDRHKDFVKGKVIFSAQANFFKKGEIPNIRNLFKANNVIYARALPATYETEALNNIWNSRKKIEVSRSIRNFWDLRPNCPQSDVGTYYSLVGGRLFEGNILYNEKPNKN